VATHQTAQSSDLASPRSIHRYARSGVRARIARHPYAAVTSLVVTVGWAAALVPILASRGVIPGRRLVELSPAGVEETAALATMAVLVPAALWVAWLADGPGRIRVVTARMRFWRIGLRGWFLALAALPVTTIGVGIAFGRSPDLSTSGIARQLGALLVALVAINLWEEGLWSGLVQTRLEVRHRLPVAALLTAVPFALLHVPLRFVEDAFSLSAAATQLGALVVLGFVVRLLIGVVRLLVQPSCCEADWVAGNPPPRSCSREMHLC